MRRCRLDWERMRALSLAFLRELRERDEGGSARAFTLVELLVATAVFAVIMVGLVGAYLTLLVGSAKVRSQQELLDSLHAALQHLERLAAQAEVVACGNNLPASYLPAQHEPCPTGGNTLVLVLNKTEGKTVAFRFANNSLERTVAGGYAPLISPRVQVTSGQFIIGGGSQKIAPRVTMTVEGLIAAGSPRRSASPFAIQSTFAPPMSYDLPASFGTVDRTEGSGVVQCIFNNKPGFLVIAAGAGYKLESGNSNMLFVLPSEQLRMFFGKQIEWDTAPFYLTGTSTIPAGTYDAVYVQGWDNHCDPSVAGHSTPCPNASLTTYENPHYNASDIQPYERMIVGFYHCNTDETGTCNPFKDSNVEEVWVSDPAASPDIPEPVDFLPFASTTPVSGQVTLTKAVNLVVFYHAGMTDNGRICSFAAGKPRTPANYHCPTWEDQWNHSVVPACVALKFPTTSGSDIQLIRARPF